MANSFHSSIALRFSMNLPKQSFRIAGLPDNSQRLACRDTPPQNGVKPSTSVSSPNRHTLFNPLIVEQLKAMLNAPANHASLAVNRRVVGFESCRRNHPI
jgi:hypothetical protein